jgi:Ca2+-binding RTX toxin-like protein
VTLTNGVLTNFTGSGSSYTATFTATTFDNLTGSVSVAASSYNDEVVGNTGGAGSNTISMVIGLDPNDFNPASSSGSATGRADTINGTTGNDTIRSGAGADLVYGGVGSDTIGGGVGKDSLYGGSGDDSINGGAGNDLIFGGSGNDTINGGAGIDTITGGYGNDYLTGGGNNDTFRFLSIYDETDTITDFGTSGRDNDVIVFDTTGFASGTGGQFAFSNLGSVALGTTNYTGAIAGGYLTYSGGVLSYDHDGSTGTAWSAIAVVTLTGTPTLRNTNVLFQNI